MPYPAARPLSPIKKPSLATLIIPLFYHILPFHSSQNRLRPTRRAANSNSQAPSSKQIQRTKIQVQNSPRAERLGRRGTRRVGHAHRSGPRGTGRESRLSEIRAARYEILNLGHGGHRAHGESVRETSDGRPDTALKRQRPQGVAEGTQDGKITRSRNLSVSAPPRANNPESQIIIRKS
jgi:hypothetical protein